MNQQVVPPAAQPVHPIDFEVFYPEAWQRVFRPLSIVLRDHELAKEAVDEAMVRTYQRWRQVRTYANPVGWVYRVALNYARNRMRSRRREVPFRISDATWEMETPNPELMKAVLRLPLPQREVLVLRYLHDWSEHEVATALGIPLGTVKSRLHRAVAALREVVT
jgi:RNA polymerase sigma factor (sigma-70 family)